MSQILNDTQTDKAKGAKHVLVGGCFDILHPAHVEFLRNSKKLGEKLILLLESDENIRRIKGDKRPVNNQITRAYNLSNLELVDYIILLNKPNSSQYYYNLVKLLHPAIIAITQGDLFLEDKKKQAEMVGGKVVEVMNRNPLYSTTAIIEGNKNK